MKYETDEEFDDGGTPMWRARQRELRRSPPHQGVTITIPKKREPKSFREALDMLTPAENVAVFMWGPVVLFAGIIVLLAIIGVGYMIIHDTMWPPTADDGYKAALWQIEH